MVDKVKYGDDVRECGMLDIVIMDLIHFKPLCRVGGFSTC